MPALRRRWTAEDVRALTREDRAWPRYELIAGELLVTPAPGYPHQFVAMEFFLVLAPYVNREEIGVAVMSPADVALEPGTITQPDVFVIPTDTAIDANDLREPNVQSLLLAIEVLSPSSLRTDRVEKRDFYLEHGVAEYWIADFDARVVERWRPEQETPQLRRDQLEWAPLGHELLAIDLPALFARVDTNLSRTAGWRLRRRD